MPDKKTLDRQNSLWGRVAGLLGRHLAAKKAQASLPVGARVFKRKPGNFDRRLVDLLLQDDQRRVGDASCLEHRRERGQPQLLLIGRVQQPEIRVVGDMPELACEVAAQHRCLRLRVDALDILHDYIGRCTISLDKIAKTRPTTQRLAPKRARSTKTVDHDGTIEIAEDRKKCLPNARRCRACREGFRALQCLTALAAGYNAHNSCLFRRCETSCPYKCKFRLTSSLHRVDSASRRRGLSTRWAATRGVLK